MAINLTWMSIVCFLPVVQSVGLPSCLGTRVVLGRYLPVDFFQRIVGLSINDCGKECLARPRCHSFNFDQRFRACYLNNQSSSALTPASLQEQTHYAFGERADIPGQEDFQTCQSDCGTDAKCNRDGSTNSCSFPDCGPPADIANADRHGNMWSTGRRVKYECRQGYHATGSQLVSTCQGDGQWTDTDLVCEPDGCDPNWHTYERTTTTCIYLNKTRLTWDAAKDNCRTLGAELAKVVDNDKHNFTKSLVQNTFNGPNYWLGGRRHNGTSTWLDGSVVTEWIEEPRDIYNGHCLSLADLNTHWYFDKCNKPMYSICEKALR